jgi:hypothetical protein
MPLIEQGQAAAKFNLVESKPFAIGVIAALSGRTLTSRAHIGQAT